MASTAFLPAMIPPFEIVVRSPPNGVEISAQTPSETRSRFPKGSRATVAPNEGRAHMSQRARGMTAATNARCAAQDTDWPINSRRETSLIDVPPNECRADEKLRNRRSGGYPLG